MHIENYQQDSLSAELTYMMSFFGVFCLLIEDMNEINRGKCKKMHPLK